MKAWAWWMIELELDADARQVVDDVKSNVDAITTFPVETEKPIIQELTTRNRVADIAVSGYVDPFTLKALSEQVRNELSNTPEITQVDIVSAPPYEISIEVSEVALRRHGRPSIRWRMRSATRRLIYRVARCEPRVVRSCFARSVKPTGGGV